MKILNLLHVASFPTLSTSSSSLYFLYQTVFITDEEMKRISILCTELQSIVKKMNAIKTDPCIV